MTHDRPDGDARREAIVTGAARGIGLGLARRLVTERYDTTLVDVDPSVESVVALTRIAANEFGPHGVTVNSICPGYVLTDMGADARDEEQVANWTAMSPLGRLADVDDIASLVTHLASDGASYITGQALNVTGGMCTS